MIFFYWERQTEQFRIVLARYTSQHKTFQNVEKQVVTISFGKVVLTSILVTLKVTSEED